MSIIKNLDGDYPLFSMDKAILQEKINLICEKIHFDDSKVSWYIYNPNLLRKDLANQLWLINNRGAEYGCCNPDQNEIYISLKCIKYEEERVSPINVYCKKDFDLLAEVIIDEITHIQTGKDHGNKVYELAHKKNKDKFYFSSQAAKLIEQTKEKSKLSFVLKF